MNILIVSAPNPHRVAGTVALNLMNGLRQHGHRVTLIIRDHGDYQDPAIVNLQGKAGLLMQKLGVKLQIALDRVAPHRQPRNPDYCVQDADETRQFYGTDFILRKAGFVPDVILYIFPGSLLNARNLYELNQRTKAPVFWYLMDSAALTGGCHYSWDCMGYTTGCGRCPALHSQDPEDQSAINFRFKQKYLAQTDIRIISATEWQHRMAGKSLLFESKPKHKILLPVDPEVFTPGSMHEARAALGIAADRQVIFFGSAQLDERRKGMAHLVAALRRLKDTGHPAADRILLLVAGTRFEAIRDQLPFETRHLGLLSNDRALAQAFQAADFFVCPSIEDSGPMMINQALMCGRPVVAFEMGVALDLVVTGQTGYLARLKDDADLAQGIATMLALEPAARAAQAEHSRRVALQHCSPAVQIERFERLFTR